MRSYGAGEDVKAGTPMGETVKPGADSGLVAIGVFMGVARDSMPHELARRPGRFLGIVDGVVLLACRSMLATAAGDTL